MITTTYLSCRALIPFCLAVILLQAVSAQVNLQQHQIGIMDGPSWMEIADMDNDGDRDVIVSGYRASQIRWYEYPDWQEHVIASYIYRAKICATDIDGDGDVDIAATSWATDLLCWYENPSWTMHVIDSGVDGSYGIDAADMNGDGIQDLIVAGGYHNCVAWYKGPDWQKNIIDGNVSMYPFIPDQVFVTDLDGDSDFDVLVSTYNDNGNLTEGSLIYYQQLAVGWNKTVIDPASGYINSLDIADLDNDGLPEVAAALAGLDKIVYYNWPAWDAVVVDGLLNYAFNLDIGDVNRDGVPDIVACGQMTMNPCRLYFGPSWTPQYIYQLANNFYDVEIVDLDDDNDQDIVATNIENNRIFWFENRMSPDTIHVPADFTTIQAAIDYAPNNVIILVDDGEYYENINFKGKAVTVASAYLVDGDTSHISATVIDGSATQNQDSSSVVYFISGEDTTSVLCGFTIRGGTGTLDDDPAPGRGGGGIYVRNSGATIRDNIIRDNHVYGINRVIYGGAIASSPMSGQDWLVVRNNRIFNNTAHQSGEAQYAAAGGGICALTNARIENNTIENNCARSDRLSAWGGGVTIGTDYQVGLKMTWICANNKIRYNVAETMTGGNVYDAGIGGGLAVWGNPAAIITGNEICFNEVRNNDCTTERTYGAGVMLQNQNSETLFSGNYVADNLAEAGSACRGAGICLWSFDIPCSPRLENNIIVKNRNGYQGGGVYSGGYKSNRPQLINNTICDNQAQLAGTMYNSNGSVVVINSILWGNSSGIQNYGGTTYLRYSTIQGGWTGEGNSSCDPLLVPDDPYYCLQCTGDTSHCLNTGCDSVQILLSWYHAPEYDFAGNPRPSPLGTPPDRGAWEYSVLNSVQPLAGAVLPRRLELSDNYPDPFNPETTIEFKVPVAGMVTLTVYDVLGQKITTLHSGKLAAGHYRYVWNAEPVSSGIYLCRLQAGKEVRTIKMTVLK